MQQCRRECRERCHQGGGTGRGKTDDQSQAAIEAKVRIHDQLVGLELPALLNVDVLQQEDQVLGVRWHRDVLLVVPEVQAVIVDLWVAMDVRHLAGVAPAQHRRCDQGWRDRLSRGAERCVGDHGHVVRMQMG